MQVTGNPQVIGSSAELLPINALVLTGVTNFRVRQLLPGLFPKLSFPEYAWKLREQSKARRSCRTYCVSPEATFRVPVQVRVVLRNE